MISSASLMSANAPSPPHTTDSHSEGGDHLRADDQGGYIPVQLPERHPVSFDRDTAQQNIKPVQFIVRAAHCSAFIQVSTITSTIAQARARR